MKELGHEYLIQTTQGHYYVAKWLKSKTGAEAFYAGETTVQDDGITVDQCGFVFDNESVDVFAEIDLIHFEDNY
jgi:hypothetical protein